MCNALTPSEEVLNPVDSDWASDIEDFTDRPWTPKPWKMKVLNPQHMGYNP